ncbi:MAG: glycosylhydrolase-like jelly roll fold domain-containing protein, partial [Planctomycetota bacterium]
HYIHRRSDDADIYFVSNQQSKSVSARCTFRVGGKQPEIWDAVTGEMRNATAFEIAGGRCTLPLEFAARGSLFVVFRKPTRSLKGTSTANYARLIQVGEITGPWIVKFDPKWGGPESVVFEKLDDWTQRSEPGIKFYSGKATYHKTFELTEAAKGTKKRLYLDLKRIRNVAHVRLNGKDLGVVWTAPWRVDITQAVKPTGNKLKIDVVNLWPNRLIGDAALLSEKRLTKTNVTKFKKNSQLLSSGLLGPVQLITEGKLELQK